LEYLWRWNAIALLVGWQLGFTKLVCFLCEWDSHTKDHHFCKRMAPTSVISICTNELKKQNTSTSKENIFTSDINQAWCDEEFCQSYRP
jgi:hypothetical protein